MLSERVQGQVDRLLTEAEEAIASGDWETVAVRTRSVLALDPDNADASAYLAAAERNLGQGEVTLPAATAPASIRVSSSPRPADPDSFVGGRYHVLRFLGEGGKKRVFLAHDTLLDRDVAFALIKTEGLDEAGQRRIVREAQAMGRLGADPHIVSVFDLGEEPGPPGTMAQPFIVTELMVGGDLEGLIEKAPDHQLPLEQTLTIGKAVCQGLVAAHNRGVVHRDLKPGNVWLTADGTAKIGDFGLAVALDRSRLTQAGMMVGTVDYMPPEQALGGAVTPQSDLYSLGAMLYEMATGRPPFVADDITAIVTQHLTTAPVAPSWLSEHCPPDLDALILALLAKEPSERPESAQAACDVLARIDPAQGSASHSQPGTNPLARLAPGVFVGREAELTRLREAFDQAFSGAGRLVMLAGEAGIGKTSTVHELETYARVRGAQVLWGEAFESGGAPAYWPWIQAGRSWAGADTPERLRGLLGDSTLVELARLFPDARLSDGPPPPVVDAEAAQFALFDAFVQFLRAISAERPALLVLDDLHWADKPSLLLLQHLARELGRLRVLVVAGYRDTDLARSHPLAEALADLTRSAGFVRLPLRGLSREEVQAYVRTTAGAAPASDLMAQLYDETEGNPFFVREVVNLLTQEGTLLASRVSDIRVPEGVKEALGRRLDRLTPETNATLQVAAIIGREFTFEVLATLAQRGALGDAGEEPEERIFAQIEEAVAARVVEELPQPGRYRFTHALMQETLLGELSTTRRVRLEGQVGEALELRWGTRADERATRLAKHFMEAAALTPRYTARAVHYGKLAEEQSEAQAAWEEGASWAEALLSLASGLEGGAEQAGIDEAALLTALGRCQRNGGQNEQSWSNLKRAIDLYRGRGDHVGQASATLEAARTAVFGVPPGFIPLAEEALGALKEGEAPDIEGRLAVVTASSLGPEQWEEHRARAERLIATYDVPGVEAHLLAADALRAINFAMNFDEAARCGHEAYLAFDRMGERTHAANCLDSWVAGVLLCGRLQEGQEAIEEAAAYLRRFHLAGNQASAVPWAAALRLARADYAGFDAITADETGRHDAMLDILIALRWARCGDLNHAVAILPDPANAGDDQTVAIWVQCVRARVIWLTGDLDAARREWALLMEVSRPVAGGVEPVILIPWIASAVDDALADLAGPDFVTAAAWAGEPVSWYSPNLGDSTVRVDGGQHLSIGNVERAETRFREALEWSEREGCPVEAGRCLQGLAEVADRQGRPDEAVELLDRAAALFQQHGAALYLKQVLAHKEILKA
jgi:tetratricopeptide (TPR) repeat protein